MKLTRREAAAIGIDPKLLGPATRSKPKARPEEEFTAAVLKLASLRGWRCLHIRPGMTKRGKWVTAMQGDGCTGFPDLLLIRGHRLIVSELKIPPNKLTPDQQSWLLAFGGAGIEAYVWRPDDWPAIERTLQ